MVQWLGSFTTKNDQTLAGVFMINGEPWVFENCGKTTPLQSAPAVVNIPWKEIESIRNSLRRRDHFTATISGSTMEIVWANGVRITANIPHSTSYGSFSGEGGWRAQ